MVSANTRIYMYSHLVVFVEHWRAIKRKRRRRRSQTDRKGRYPMSLSIVHLKSKVTLCLKMLYSIRIATRILVCLYNTALYCIVLYCIGSSANSDIFAIPCVVCTDSSHSGVISSFLRQSMILFNTDESIRSSTST